VDAKEPFPLIGALFYYEAGEKMSHVEFVKNIGAF
jgi:hypothetical protein